MDTLLVHNLDHHPTRPYTDFVDVQGDFKTYPHIDRLTARIQTVGFKYDFFVWESTEAVTHQGRDYPVGTPFIMDAHARQRVLAVLAESGMTIPPVPYTRVYAPSFQAAQEELLFLNSYYGEIQAESEFLDRLMDAPIPWDMLALPELSAFESQTLTDTRQHIDVIDDSDATQPTPASQSDVAVFPLAIVLTRDQFQEWQAYKARIGKKTDTLAFITLLTKNA